jgi:excinuclease ABC subunit B
MGPGTDMERPVRSQSPRDRGEQRDGSLFKKPDLDHIWPDITTPSPRGESLFKRNNLDEMTVRRTEKPLAANPLPEKPVEPTAKVKGRTSPLLEGQPERTDTGPKDDGYRPIIRAKTGVGSYEDERPKKGKGKTGKPGA